MLPVVGEDQFRDYWSKMGIHGCVGPDGTCSRVLRKVVDVIAGLLSTMSERWWWSWKVPSDWEEANVKFILKESKEDPRKLQTGQLHLCLLEGYRADLPGGHFQAHVGQEVTAECRDQISIDCHGNLTPELSCLKLEEIPTIPLRSWVFFLCPWAKREPLAGQEPNLGLPGLMRII